MSFPALSQHVILLAGQSNATGQGDKLASNSLYQSRNAFEYDVILVLFLIRIGFNDIIIP